MTSIYLRNLSHFQVLITGLRVNNSDQRWKFPKPIHGSLSTASNQPQSLTSTKKKNLEFPTSTIRRTRHENVICGIPTVYFFFYRNFWTKTFRARMSGSKQPWHRLEFALYRGTRYREYLCEIIQVGLSNVNENFRIWAISIFFFRRRRRRLVFSSLWSSHFSSSDVKKRDVSGMY